MKTNDDIPYENSPLHFMIGVAVIFAIALVFLAAGILLTFMVRYLVENAAFNLFGM